MGMGERSFRYWFLAIKEGGCTPEAMAQLLASLSAADARSMFWTRKELGEAFGVGDKATQLWLRRNKIRPVRLGAKLMYSKLAVLDRLHDEAMVDLVLAAGASPLAGAPT